MAAYKIQKKPFVVPTTDGKLIEEGSHKVLLNEKGFYYDLYTTQFKDLVIE